MNFNAARRLLDAPQARSALSRPAALIVAIGHHDACTLAAIGYTVSKTAVVVSRVAKALTCKWCILSAPLARKLFYAYSWDRLALVEI